MIRKALKYLFPKLSGRQKLPLLPLTYSLDAKQTIPDDLQVDINSLKIAAVARNDHDALQLRNKYPELTIKQIIDKHKRIRRRSNKWARAWERLKARW